MLGVMSAAAAGAALSKAGEATADDIYSQAKSAGRQAISKLRAQFGVGVSEYVERTYSRCQKVKTILHRIDPVSIESCYVEPRIRIQKEVIRSSNIISEIKKTKNVIITGLGGSGKSILLTFLFISLCSKSAAKIPIFFELKDINEGNGKSIFEMLFDQWKSLVPGLTVAQLDYAFRKGHFIVLFDALDEIDHENRDKYSKEILELTYKYSACHFVITSRPDDRFSSWSEFYTASILPFEKDQVVDLVEKIEFDSFIKKKFVKEVKSSLYNSHREYLSNPLLCTMMLMTYNEFEETPSKMYIFYQRAFDTLFIRHDRTKPQFKRKFLTSLAEDDFERLFSSFCLVSYMAGKNSFDEETARKFVKTAIKIDKIDVDPKKFLADLSDSVSIMVKEGEVLSFLHRSFQEYFVALFFSERESTRMLDLFRPVLSRSSSDSAVALLREMNNEVFESKYFGPVLSNLRRKIDDCGNDDAKVLSLFYSETIGDEKKARSLYPAEWNPVLQVLVSSYGTGPLVRALSNRHKPYWDELFVKVGRGRKGSDKGRSKSRERQFVKIVVEKIPKEVLDRIKLKSCAAAVRRSVRAVDDKLRKRAEDRRDVLSELLDELG